MRRLFQSLAIASLAMSLAVPSAFAGPQQTSPQDQSSNKNDERSQKNVKRGSEQDVDAIGNRNVGKGINLYSLEREIALGKGAAQEVEKSSKLITDPVVVEYVNRVGQNLVRNSDAKVPFTIK